MPVHEDDMILSTIDYFVSENRLNPKATAAEISAFVKSCGTTGTITTTTNSGGVQGVIVFERKKLNEVESNDVRRVLGMDYEIEVDGDEEDDA